ncbi:MAG: hypothetical protein Rhob2KO_34210 [Rhodopirellula baltica]
MGPSLPATQGNLLSLACVMRRRPIVACSVIYPDRRHPVKRAPTHFVCTAVASYPIRNTDGNNRPSRFDDDSVRFEIEVNADDIPFVAEAEK